MDVCYIIANEFGKTYNGYTNNIKKRIRQHNREISGGAKETKNGKWHYLAILTGFADNHEALSCEWKIKHPTNKKRRPIKYCSVNGRILSLNLVLGLDVWTSKSDGLINGNEYTLYVKDDLRHLIDENLIKRNIVIESLDNFLLDL